MPRTNFRSTYPRWLYIQSGFDLPNGDLPNGLGEKDVASFVIDTEGRTDAGPRVSYKLTYGPLAQVR